MTGDRHRVLLVETDVLARTTVAEYLRGCGYHVVEVGNLEDATRILTANYIINVIVFHAAIAATGKGFAFARRLRERFSQIDVVMVSGVQSMAEKAAQLCDDGPLERPYHPQELARRIERLREKRKAKR